MRNEAFATCLACAGSDPGRVSIHRIRQVSVHLTCGLSIPGLSRMHKGIVASVLVRPTALLVVIIIVLVAALGGADRPVVPPMASHEERVAQAPAVSTGSNLTTVVPQDPTRGNQVEQSGHSSPDEPLPASPVASDADEQVNGDSLLAPLTPEQLRDIQPDEMGAVLILEYHVITTDPAEEAQFVRMADDMRADLAWLHENNFYIVSLSEVVDNRITAPAGKYPVVLTFDDATSSQFRYLMNEDGSYRKDKHGEYVIDPDCAVGILENFSDEHPDFGRGGHFAPNLTAAFSWPDDNQWDVWEHKVRWLVENGYEIGNHTHNHTDLTDITTEEFAQTVAEPVVYFNELVGDVPGNASDILTLPYGTTPDGELHPDQRQMMDEGFDYQGNPIRLRGALLVGANPTVSPSHIEWAPMWIPRIQMFDESVSQWFGAIERGELELYMSDGHPHIVTVPVTSQPNYNGLLDIERVTSDGCTVVQYDTETGEIMSNEAVNDTPEGYASDSARPILDAVQVIAPNTSTSFRNARILPGVMVIS